MAAVLPVAYIAHHAIGASRNVVFWDEFDTALGLILRLHAGGSAAEILRSFFAITNEHRILTSRLIFAVGYWLTGTVNFHLIGAVGNLCLIAACTRLLSAAGSGPRRLRLGVILAFGIFQLENFESFLWSGASIDHFQVVLYAVAAIAAVARLSRPALLAGGLLALLANFTLAHGCLVWPVGALMLVQARRGRHLVIWCGLAAVVLLAFFHDFQVNPGHALTGASLAALGRIGHYWLVLLGGPPALGSTVVAPYLGVLLLAALVVLGAKGAARREPVFYYVAVFAASSLGLVAIGRTEVSAGQILSRYLILGTLAWALVLFLVSESLLRAVSLCRWLLWVLPGLGAFNVAANARYLPLAEGYAEARDRAASRFLQYGDDVRGAVRLHPRSGHARAVLDRAAQAGIYRLPALCHPATIDGAAISTRLVAHVDEITVSAQSVYLGGWAMLPNQVSHRGQIHVVLRSSTRELVFTTLSIQRPDVALAYQEPRWRLCGFRFAASRLLLPREDFQVGLLIDRGNTADYVMTERWLRLSNDATPQPWISNDS